jgi:hypothetical protein
LFADGIINYRIGSKSELTKEFKIKKAPSFILLNKNSEVVNTNGQDITEPLREGDLKVLLNMAQ